jgi:hypothetical protein
MSQEVTERDDILQGDSDDNRHLPIAEQLRTRRQKLIGDFAYYGITGHSIAQAVVRHLAIRIWRRWLSR